jgi:hypothetical protein
VGATGNGGNSLLGGGARPRNILSPGNYTGFDGQQYGGAGSGGCASIGGSGAAGVVVVEEFY